MLGAKPLYYHYIKAFVIKGDIVKLLSYLGIKIPLLSAYKLSFTGGNYYNQIHMDNYILVSIDSKTFLYLGLCSGIKMREMGGDMRKKKKMDNHSFL